MNHPPYVERFTPRSSIKREAPQRLGLDAIGSAADVGERATGGAELRLADDVGPTQIAGDEVSRIE